MKILPSSCHILVSKDCYGDGPSKGYQLRIKIVFPHWNLINHFPHLIVCWIPQPDLDITTGMIRSWVLDALKLSAVALNVAFLFSLSLLHRFHRLQSYRSHFLSGCMDQLDITVVT